MRELSEIDAHIKTFIHQIYKYNEQIYKLISYHDGVLTFVQLTSCPSESQTCKISLYDKELKHFIWLVPYKRGI